MTVINLDENERIDEIQIQGVTYLAGDIPHAILRKIQSLKVGFFSHFFGDSLQAQWKTIIHDYLSIKNKQVEMRYWTDRHIQSMILYITKRLHEEYEGGADL